MNKTSIEVTQPCGCIVRHWAFGREVVRRCAAHPVESVPGRSWSER